MLLRMRLSPPCARILGALVEKALTTPQQYPLTLNALVAACNQASNREPVVHYDEAMVDEALHELKDDRLVRFVLPSHGRSVVRYRHVLDESLGLDAAQSAVLAMLLLRGPQTVGELRARTERMAPIDGLRGVEHELELLAARDEPLVTSMGRRPGQKEGRWASLLLDVEPKDGDAPDPDGAGPRPTPATAPAAPPADDLRAEVSALRSEVAQLRRELDQLRTNLGD
jgi:uncharacterized protein